MLVLSRRPGEDIVINGGTPDQVTIYIREMDGSKVRLGFDAPPHISIHRGEIHERIMKEGNRRNG